MEEQMKNKVSRFFDSLPPSRSISIQTHSNAIIDSIPSESLKDIMPTVCQLATMNVLRELQQDRIIQEVFTLELANNKGVIIASIQDSNILKLYEGMRFILGHIEMNHKEKVMAQVNAVLLELSGGRTITLAATFEDFKCLQLLTYSSQPVPKVSVFYTNDDKWYHKFGATGRNIYAHNQWTRYHRRAALWKDCFHWDMDLVGMADYGERFGVYQGKVVSWNGTGVPEQVFETYSTECPFATFICDRASLIAQLLGKDVVFAPTTYCIL